MAHLIQEFKLHFGKLADADVHVNDILEGGGVLVVAFDGDDGRDNAFGLNLVEAEAQLVEIVDASFLHDAHIVGMVRDAHPVAFVIFHFVMVGVHCV